jgi:6-phosphogluconolactonase
VARTADCEVRIFLSFNLNTFPTADELAEAVAKEWLALVERDAQNGLAHRVALSGGRIAGHLFSAISDAAVKRRNGLATVHFFWGDERCVEPTDPESNYRLARELLLEPAAVPETNIHRIRGEALPAAAAALATQELLGLAPLDGQGRPMLDLVFLGMGEDGHVASLFPVEDVAMTNDRSVYRPVVAVKPPPHRITLGYGPIVAARQIWVLASGAGKEGALKDSLGAEGQTPLARVLQLRQKAGAADGGTRIFTDIAV